MTLDELIKRLEEIKAEHGGELPVSLDFDNGLGSREIYDLKDFVRVDKRGNEFYNKGVLICV